ncbi:MAG: peptidylprolyl isomerase [Myxococcota bacterium]|nr:peptidylprolyl isomerase [Myxococcota bacterium]
MSRPPNLWLRGFSGVHVLMLCALFVGSSACRAPRDPDLDQRLAKAAEPAPPPSPESQEKGEESSPAKARGTESAPPKGEIVLRKYTDKDLASIMAAIPGSGETISVELSTQMGPVHCTLDVAGAPQISGNFIALALGLRPWRDPDTGEEMKSPFYDGLSFHRCITGFIIQTGNPSTVRAGGPGWTLPREPGKPARFQSPGALAMVDAGDDTHGSQFFITLRPSTSLKDRYTAFGHCENLELVRKIADAEKLPPSTEGKSATRPRQPVRLDQVRVTRRDPAPTP